VRVTTTLRPALLSLVTLVAVAAATPAAAQTTGRHRPAVAEPAPADTAAAETKFLAGFQVGIMDSGDLFRVRTLGESGIPWDPPGGGPAFVSSDFVVTLDADVAFSVLASLEVSRWLAVRADLTHGRMDMTAEARQGEIVNIYAWDRLTVTLIGVVLEARLVSSPSYLYVLAGPGLTLASGSTGDTPDQTRLAGRFGAGYHHALGRRFGLRAEVSCNLQQLDFADYVPPYQGNVAPNATVAERGPQQIWQMTLGFNARF